MAYLIVGLGNPGLEYAGTRHNTGRMLVTAFAKQCGVTEWKKDAKNATLRAKGECSGEQVVFLLPDAYMNRSGKSLVALVKSKKAAERLLVVHDDLDLPLGTSKVSWNRGPGGHRGVISIIAALKTEAFVRVRVGISPTTTSGKLKKPQGEEAVNKFILGTFSSKEKLILEKMSATVSSALESIITAGHEHAMNLYN